MAKFTVYTKYLNDEKVVCQEKKNFRSLTAAVDHAEEEVLWESTTQSEVVDGSTGEVVESLEGSFNWVRA